MRRVLSLLAALLVTSGLPIPTVAAQAELAGAVFEEIVLRPQDGTVLSWNGRRFAGTMEIRNVDGALVLVETLSLDDYLLGIQEVPFSWEAEALRAQAVAARTYLAWTVSIGRNGAAATYGFDICATDQCQVYGGLSQLEGEGGERWAAAIRDTAEEILLTNGRPAQALYSSTAGDRTRSVQDVFDSGPVSYLQAVESPGEDSPFVEWTVELTGSEFGRVLRAADLAVGALRDVEVVQTQDGNGPWVVAIESSGGLERLSTWSFRRAMNRSGPSTLPDLLPAERPDGRRYPQTILSPTYEIERTWTIGSDFTAGYVPATPVYSISGSGWGHQVGMSQYGAQAMAEAGSGYPEILSHYYSGLAPQPGAGVLPETVEVGLTWGDTRLELAADGPFDLVVDGEVVIEGGTAEWAFAAQGDGVAVVAGDGAGFPPVLRAPDRSDHAAGAAVLIEAELSAPAEVRLVVFDGPRLVSVGEWQERDAGTVRLIWDGAIDDAAAQPGTYTALIVARNADGRDAAVTMVSLGGS